MKEILDELKSCLYEPTYGTGGMGANKDFETWLLQSNCSTYLSENSSLQEIFDVLMKSPQADYFWYSHKGELTWAEPHQDEVPLYSLRVDKEKITVFLRDIKIKSLLK